MRTLKNILGMNGVNGINFENIIYNLIISLGFIIMVLVLQYMSTINWNLVFYG